MSDEEIRKKREEERRRRLELIALLALLYTNMEDEMLGVIAENLNTDDFTGSPDTWRMKHLAAAEAVGKAVSHIAGTYAAVQKQVFCAAVDDAAKSGAAWVDAALGGSGSSSAGTASRVAEYFRKQAKHDINTVNTVMRYKAKQGYVTAVNSAFFSAKESERVWKALGEGAFDVASGRASLQSAVRGTIVKMSEKGIPAFIDKAGREWSPEAYVRMDIRTTAANTARQAQWERCREQGINLIEVSSHSGARPLCAPYQGGIYSLDGTSGTCEDASGREINYIPLSSTSYGQAAGLFGINCGHQSYPFRAGVNFRRYYPLETEEEFAENSKRYAEFQKQRAMERNIRSAKRECMMCDKAGDKDGFEKASQKLARRRQAYRDYSKSVGLKQHNDRTQVYGFDRSISGKSVWAARKSSGKGLTSAGGSGKISLDGMYRRTSNTGDFKDYPEPMQQKHIKSILKDLGINNDGIEYDIIRDKELIGTGVYGYTFPNGKKVQLYPDAFSSRKNLVKTIGHERIHCEQVKLFGNAQNTEELREYERAAEFSENYWWGKYLERTGYNDKT